MKEKSLRGTLCKAGSHIICLGMPVLGAGSVETLSPIPWISETAYLHAKFRFRQGSYGFVFPILALVSFVLVIFLIFVVRSRL